MPTIGFIGGGNMARSLIGGLINAGIAATDITVAEPDAARSSALKQQFGINACSDNNKTLQCEIVVLAVKPQLLKSVCRQLDTSGDSNTLFITIAAGVRSTDIDRWLAHGQNAGNFAIVRCMPNTPALLQCGASGLFANAQVSETQKQQAEEILQAVGLVIWVSDEEQLNAVTAVSGSGPAYFFLMMEAMQQAGEKLGLPADIAQQLVLQTALGAARMATEGHAAPAELRQQVTSKGGTTEQAILSFQSANFQHIVFQALAAANDRSISLAEELASE
jgi:pyrroline-5-carboxylate reductase